MQKIVPVILIISSLLFIPSCDDDEKKDDQGAVLQLTAVRVGTYPLHLSDFTKNNAAPSDKPVLIVFSTAVDQNSVSGNVQLKEKSSGTIVLLTFSFLDSDKTISAQSSEIKQNTNYQLIISENLRGANGEKFPGYVVEFATTPGTLSITSLKLDGQEVLNTQRIKNVDLENDSFIVTFSAAVDPSTATASAFRVSGFSSPAVSVQLSNENRTVTVTITQKLFDLRKYALVVTDALKGANQETFSQVAKTFYTAADPIPDHPVISDDALLTLVQQQTFKYFWDFAHPASGMARERNSSGDLVTTGGSGFGLMAIIVGIERGFITRQQGIERLDKILDFLETADRFHGAWPHWINGNTGDVIPFSTNDNGGDLVETGLLVQGLLTFRQYLNALDPTELALRNRITNLYEGVEWNWYRNGGQNVLYWHWSPDKGWIMNHQIRGYNETLIVYVLAAASPTNTIPLTVYQQGWASNGGMKNGKSFYSITLPLGPDYGGPLFFAHYSYLGLDPRNLEDQYANYWTQNVNHTLINRAYVIANPKNFVGYSADNWGLTASDNHMGYSAHSPTNDLGVISPTAALSSFPYTPEESMKALKFFYYTIGDRLWGTYGFYDAFNLTEGWTASSFLAIDQGPIIVMIENHRSELLWDLFMSAPEVQDGLDKLGFTY